MTIFFFFLFLWTTLKLAAAALLAPLLSIVIFAGKPEDWIDFLKNRFGAFTSRFALNRKSMLQHPAVNGGVVDLNPALLHHLLRLTAALIQSLDRFSDFTWTTLNWSVVNAFFASWEPIWSRCGATAFAQKKERLLQNLDALFSTSD